MYKKHIIHKILVLSFICFCGLFHFQCSSDSDPQGRYIFVDGGAHLGWTINAFKETKLYSEHQWKIYAFECNPELIERLPGRIAPSEDVEIIDKAIWIHSEGLEFNFGKSTLGGNVVNNQYTEKAYKSIRVESVDFGDWLKENFEVEDNIFVKLDIEGAEYEVLDKMFRDGSIKYLDKLYIEFHSFIMEDVTEEMDKELIRKITKLGIPIYISPPNSEEGDYFSGK